ncbi:MAG: hypothetical protein IPO07_12825 [Haliscomenobacter sp.]|nr:hypothetical protein [Haliscomenobacter sp.]MBK9489565.1 hypothetical protein [Haliscomenobacter sp.]
MKKPYSSLQCLLLIFGVAFITSCNGQVKEENRSLKVEKVSEVVKIPVPKGGFSNGYAEQRRNYFLLATLVFTILTGRHLKIIRRKTD